LKTVHDQWKIVALPPSSSTVAVLCDVSTTELYRVREMMAGRGGWAKIEATGMMADRIFELFARHGGECYGEEISVQDNMLQSAYLARTMGATDSLIVATLLHDIGYLLYAEGIAPKLGVGRGAHEAVGAAWLGDGFDEQVTAPIALHVDAKRYLCAVEPDYFETLSEASRLSLALQGGPMRPDETAAFARRPGFEDALLLRRCDDLGKDPAARTPDLESFRELLTASLRRRN
jgi:predicted HD phosphohydrolase